MTIAKGALLPTLSYGLVELGPTKPISILWLGFLAQLHFGQGDGKADHTSSSSQGRLHSVLLIFLGCGGATFIEMLISYDIRAGERLDIECAVPEIQGKKVQICVGCSTRTRQRNMA